MPRFGFSFASWIAWLKPGIFVKQVVEVSMPFLKASIIPFYIDTNELYNEWKEQIEKFLETGITPTHMDTHHHVNNLDIIEPV